MKRGVFPLGIVLAIAVACVFPAAGAGAEVRLGDFSGEVEIDAPPGEMNDLALSGSRSAGASTLDVEEGGEAPLEAGEGCTETSSGVRCEMNSYLRIVFFDLRDQGRPSRRIGSAR